MDADNVQSQAGFATARGLDHPNKPPPQPPCCSFQGLPYLPGVDRSTPDFTVENLHTLDACGKYGFIPYISKSSRLPLAWFRCSLDRLPLIAMKSSVQFLLGAGCISLAMPLLPATALTFGQQEIDQTRVIAIAIPLGNSTQYQLMLLEQLTRNRPCWSESGSQPANVQLFEPNFERTDFCRRLVDSRDFSIRRNGEDLATTYSLRLVRRGNEVLLVGSPKSTNPRDRSSSELILGRTGGISSSLIKIQLNSDWRFTHRTMNGVASGHIYLSQDQAPTTVASRGGAPVSSNFASNSSSSSNFSKPSTKSNVTTRTGVTRRADGTLALPVPPPDLRRTVPPSSPGTLPSLRPNQEIAINIPVPPPSGLPPSPRQDSIPIAVPVPQNRPPSPVANLTPTLRPVASQPISIPVPPPENNLPPSPVASLTPTLRPVASQPISIPVPPPENNLPPPPVARPISVPTPAPLPLPPSAQDQPAPDGLAPLAVPSGQIPRGLQTNEPGLIASADRLPPPPEGTLLLGPRFRVVVELLDNQQQVQLRTLVPDAFRSFSQGRPVIQVGSYKERFKAEEMIQLMSSNGFQARIEAVP
uniref:Sporulation domain protein n=1 Tax=Cyanothece sp. (strain PCC 7425 / ATCC 29141) TaxID=395961 RepID=B8HY74_CYAP4